MQKEEQWKEGLFSSNRIMLHGTIPFRVPIEYMNGQTGLDPRSIYFSVRSHAVSALAASEEGAGILH